MARGVETFLRLAMNSTGNLDAKALRDIASALRDIKVSAGAGKALGDMGIKQARLDQVQLRTEIMRRREAERQALVTARESAAASRNAAREAVQSERTKQNSIRATIAAKEREINQIVREIRERRRAADILKMMADRTRSIQNIIAQPSTFDKTSAALKRQESALRANQQAWRKWQQQLHSARATALDMSYLMGNAARTSGMLLGGGLLAGGAFGRAVLTNRAQYQQAEAQIKGLTGGNPNAYGQVRQFALKSPLTFRESLDAVNQLMNANIRFDTIMREKAGYLETMTKAAVFANRPLSQVVRAMSRLNAGGYLTSQMQAIDVTKRTFEQAGIAWDEKKNRPEGLNATTGPAMLDKIMQQLAGKFASFKPEKLLGTQLSNIGEAFPLFFDAIGRRFDGLFDKVLPRIQEFMLRVIDLVGSPQFDSAFAQMADTLLSAFEKIADGAEKLLAAVSRDPEMIPRFIKGIAEGMKVLAAVFIGANLGQQVANFAQTISTIVLAFRGGPVALGMIVTILGSFAAAAVLAKGKLDELLPSFGESGKLTGEWQGLIEDLIDALVNMGAAAEPAVTALLDAFTQLMGSDSPINAFRVLLQGIIDDLNMIAGVSAALQGYKLGADGRPQKIFNHGPSDGPVSTLKHMGQYLGGLLIPGMGGSKQEMIDLGKAMGNSRRAKTGDLAGLLRSIPYGSEIEKKYPGVDDKVSCVVRTKEGLILMADGAPEAKSLIDGFTASIKSTTPALDAALNRTVQPKPGDIVVNAGKSHMGIIARIDEKGNIYGLGNSGGIDSYNFGNINKGNFTAWSNKFWGGAEGLGLPAFAASQGGQIAGNPSDMALRSFMDKGGNPGPGYGMARALATAVSSVGGALSAGNDALGSRYGWLSGFEMTIERIRSAGDKFSTALEAGAQKIKEKLAIEQFMFGVKQGAVNIRQALALQGGDERGAAYYGLVGQGNDINELFRQLSNTNDPAARAQLQASLASALTGFIGSRTDLKEKAPDIFGQWGGFQDEAVARYEREFGTLTDAQSIIVGQFGTYVGQFGQVVGALGAALGVKVQTALGWGASAWSGPRGVRGGAGGGGYGFGAAFGARGGNWWGTSGGGGGYWDDNPAGATDQELYGCETGSCKTRYYHPGDGGIGMPGAPSAGAFPEEEKKEKQAKQGPNFAQQLSGILNNVAGIVNQYKSGDKLGAGGSLFDMLFPSMGGLGSAVTGLIGAFKGKKGVIVEKIIDPIKFDVENLSMFLGANPASANYGGRARVGGGGFTIQTNIHMDGEVVAKATSRALGGLNFAGGY